MKIIWGIMILLSTFNGCASDNSTKKNENEMITAERLYKEKCGGCHAIYEKEKFSNEEWQRVLIRMGKKAHLDDNQNKLIQQYLITRSDTTEVY